MGGKTGKCDLELHWERDGQGWSTTEKGLACSSVEDLVARLAEYEEGGPRLLAATVIARHPTTNESLWDSDDTRVWTPGTGWVTMKQAAAIGPISDRVH